MTFEDDFPSLNGKDLIIKDKKLVAFIKEKFLDKQKVKEVLSNEHNSRKDCYNKLFGNEK